MLRAQFPEVVKREVEKEGPVRESSPEQSIDAGNWIECGKVKDPAPSTINRDPEEVPI